MPVIYEDRQVLAAGRYLQQIRISVFPASTRNSEGRYSLCLVDRITAQVVVLYDVHSPKGQHHRVRGNQSPYAYRDPATLIADFQRDVDLVLGGQL